MMIKKLNTVLILVLFISNCYAIPVSVGDLYGGGTVFCVSQTPDTTQCDTTAGASGEYGLIISNEDLANFNSNPQHGIPWSSVRDIIPDARSYDDGDANTAAIIATLPQDNPGNNAAWLCHNYNAHVEAQVGQVLSNWYLPSINELEKMQRFVKANNLVGENCAGAKANGIQCLIGGDRRWYWSSTEDTCYFNAVWGKYFWGEGGRYDFDKIDNHFGVRAVRAFNNSRIQLVKNLPTAHQAVPAEVVVVDKPSEIELLKEDLKRKRQDIDAAELTAIAEHHNANARLLMEIAAHHEADADTLLAVVRHPATNNIGIRTAITHARVNAAVLTVAAAHTNAAADTLLMIAQNPITEPAGLDAAVHNHNADAQVFVAVANLHNPNVNAETMAVIEHHQNVISALLRLLLSGNIIIPESHF
jgi:hypothetical protein